jgi:hypothetical protein
MLRHHQGSVDWRRFSAFALLAAGVGVGCGDDRSGAGATGGFVDVTPTFDAKNFAPGTVIDNPLLPWKVGTKYVLQSTSNEHIEITVTSDEKTIAGVACVVVTDTVTVGGMITEDTSDWFAQDRDGNVWYFGEATKALDAHGNLTDTYGSWEAGVDGAVAGVQMLAHPKVGDTYRQEFSKGVAEDQADVLATDQHVEVKYGAQSGCLETRDFTPLEEGQDELKYWCPGLGNVLSIAPDGTSELVSVTKM